MHAHKKSDHFLICYAQAITTTSDDVENIAIRGQEKAHTVMALRRASPARFDQDNDAEVGKGMAECDTAANPHSIKPA
ncbi:hypothetical protein [Henriciella sp.]|uniref:hypothetical protein n=1 Tax=Henriciella sp. TaxID=1968823 RepID=UPI00261B18B8|nr:hypothetical protein [Henriciella sp.]